ncbi:MAG: hypothetical protein AAF958_00590 [Planctomycetota bacterium]
MPSTTAQSKSKAKTVCLELTEHRYLRIPAAIAERFFPGGVFVPIVRPSGLHLIPTRGAAAGGLILKQRNLAGDRVVLLDEVIRENQLDLAAGAIEATPNSVHGGLTIQIVADEP